MALQNAVKRQATVLAVESPSQELPSRPSVQGITKECSNSTLHVPLQERLLRAEPTQTRLTRHKPTQCQTRRLALLCFACSSPAPANSFSSLPLTKFCPKKMHYRSCSLTFKHPPFLTHFCRVLKALAQAPRFINTLASYLVLRAPTTFFFF